jgi:hypothetical protein
MNSVGEAFSVTNLLPPNIGMEPTRLRSWLIRAVGPQQTEWLVLANQG